MCTVTGLYYIVLLLLNYTGVDHEGRPAMRLSYLWERGDGRRDGVGCEHMCSAARFFLPIAHSNPRRRLCASSSPADVQQFLFRKSPPPDTSPTSGQKGSTRYRYTVCDTRPLRQRPKVFCTVVYHVLPCAAAGFTVLWCAHTNRDGNRYTPS